MWRILKWFGLLVMTFVLLFTLALGLAYYFKADVLAAVNKELSKSINGEISIGDIDFGFSNFPGVAITLTNVYLRGPQYARYHKDFFRAEKFFIDLQLRPLLHKELVIHSIRVNNGNFFIFRTKSGYTNLDAFKSAKTSDSITRDNPILISFSRVNFKNVQFIYADSLKEKTISAHFLNVTNKIKKTDSSQLFALTGNMKFGELTLNAEKGSYLKKKTAHVQFNLEYISARQQLIIQPSTMKFAKSTVDLSGRFLFNSPGSFVLTIGSQKLDYQEGLSVITEAIQKKLVKYKIEKPVKFKVTVAGKLIPGFKAAVDVDFSFVNSKIAVDNIHASRVTLKGTFTNHEDSTKTNEDHNSMMKIQSFNGIIEGLPTKLTATIRDFNDPFVDMKLEVTLNLPTFNSRVDTDRIKFSKGKFNAHIAYVGKLNEYLSKSSTMYIGKLKGDATIASATVLLGPRKQIVENLNLAIKFDEREMVIDNISCLVNKSPILMKGKISGFVPFFFQPAKKGYVNLSIRSSHFDFTPLLSVKSKKKPSVKESIKRRMDLSDMIDKLYEKIEFNLALQVDELVYKNFKGSNLKSSLNLRNQRLEMNKLTMDFAGGSINLSLMMDQLQKQVNPLLMEGTVRNVDIKKFLFAFDNFQQTTVTDKQLEGRLYMKLKIKTSIDDELKVMTPSFRGNVDMSVKSGRLKDFEPLEKMSNFLMKKRDFEDVEFDEIKSRFSIRGPEMNIKRMEIESSVLRLFLEGRYSFAHHTDLSIQLPLSNLKKRDKSYNPTNVGVNTKQGLSVFLHVTEDKDGKMNIAYDPFKKYVRKSPSQK